MLRRNVVHFHPLNTVVSMNMKTKVEQCCAIQPCVHYSLTAISMVREMQGAYQNECLNKRTIMRWHKAFLEVCKPTEKLNSSG